MPICKKCGTSFPNRLKINGVLKEVHSRAYCITCSPVGTRKFCGPIRDHSKPSKRQLEKQGIKSDKICASCNRSYRSTSRNNVCTTCRGKKARNARKMKLIELNGGKCSNCGYNKCSKALQFHHIDPKDKLFALSAYLHLALDTLMKEAKKCILLCANCHAELHADNEAKPLWRNWRDAAELKSAT